MTKDKDDQANIPDDAQSEPKSTVDPQQAADDAADSASAEKTPVGTAADKQTGDKNAADKHTSNKDSGGKKTGKDKKASRAAGPETLAKEKTARKGPHPLSWINLVLMLGLFAVAAYAGWLGWQLQQDTAAEMAVLKDRLRQTQEQAGNLAAAEGDLLAETRSLQESAQTLQQQVEHNTDRLGKLPGAERQDWLLAEAEYLLRMANQRLQLEKDVEGSLSMLQAADNVLVETRNPRLNPVRKAITEEIQSLRASPAVDITGAVLRLQTLQEELPRLPWLPDRLVPDTQDTAPLKEESPDPDLPWYQTLWMTTTDALQGLIRFRERSEPIAAPLTPDQQYYLQQNMHLMLEQAQVALLRRQTDLYQHSLSRVQDWLDEYLIVDDQRTEAARLALKELRGWQVNPPLPDISGSLLQLQKLVEAQRRGTVQPGDPLPADDGADAGGRP
ncbi:MAG: hypothetical protein CMI02_07240 [Oceanospirillaceae bacterium]|nr:hypothetical protein [Oceanospirillaceae bacterium]MBT11811.1 hypothetical protein [Oceanospirillaceae bacterium]